MDVKVSVVVAVFNSEQYLKKTLDSICAQTLNEIEIICVDDGSTDNSLCILQEYAKKNPRMKILRQTKASDGAALARNMGVDAAVGEFISVLDADDFFEPDMLLKAYERAKETGAEVVLFDGDIYDETLAKIRETGMILRKEFLPPGKDVFAPVENAEILFFMSIGSAWNCLFKRELIMREKLRFSSFHHADDLGFVYAGFASAKRIAVLPERLVHYRSNNPDSQAANLVKWPEAAAGAFLALKEELVKKKLFETYRVTFTEMALHYFDLYLGRMSSYGGFEKLYLEWKNRYVRELELDRLSDGDFRQQRLRRIRNCLLTLAPGEYVFDKTNRKGLFADTASWRAKLEKGSRVLLYGAGKRGRTLFPELLGDGEYRITGWVDKNHKEIGYPVIGLDEAIQNGFDAILISLESPAAVEKIRCELRKKGIEDERILWTGEAD